MSKTKSSNEIPNVIYQEEDDVTYLPTECYFCSSRRLSTEVKTSFTIQEVPEVKEETSVSALIERRHYQKSKTIGHAALKPKFFKELCEKANDILITRTKQIERVSQWKRTEERETQWYDLSDISDFELDSTRL